MEWDCQVSILFDDAVLLPCAFTSQLLAIEVTVDNYRPSWNNSGYLQSLVDVEGEYFKGEQVELRFGKQIIQLPYFNYRLEFTPKGWLVNPVIKIKGLSTTQAINIMPNYAPMPTAIGNQPVLDSLPTSFVAPIYTAAALPATYQCLPANPARQTFAVGNTGTAPIFLDLDAPTAAAKRFITIVAGGVYVCDFDYVGAVFIWSSNGVTQTAEVRDLIQ
jgi:hypothetical protein